MIIIFILIFKFIKKIINSQNFITFIIQIVKIFNFKKIEN